MIDAWFSVLIISLIVALGGLAALLVQSYRGESFSTQRSPISSLGTVTAIGVLGSHPSFTRAACPTFRRPPRPKALRQPGRELLEGVKTQCGMVPNPGERLRIRALDDGAICRLGEILKQDVSIDSVRAVQERRKR